MTCNLSGPVHGYAVTLSDFLVTRGGAIEAPNWEIIKQSGLTPGQFERAIAHLRDAENTVGDPCLGYRVNYKWAAAASTLSLIDPADLFNTKADVAAYAERGARFQHLSQTTVQHRLARQFETLAKAWENTCIKCKHVNRCRLGRVFEQMAEEYIRLGHVTEPTMGRLRAQQQAHGISVVTW